jgi:hypothetical protein
MFPVAILLMPAVLFSSCYVIENINYLLMQFSAAVCTLFFCIETLSQGLQPLVIRITLFEEPH